MLVAVLAPVSVAVVVTLVAVLLPVVVVSTLPVTVVVIAVVITLIAVLLPVVVVSTLPVTVVAVAVVVTFVAVLSVAVVVPVAVVSSVPMTVVAAGIAVPIVIVLVPVGVLALPMVLVVPVSCRRSPRPRSGRLPDVPHQRGDILREASLTHAGQRGVLRISEAKTKRESGAENQSAAKAGQAVEIMCSSKLSDSTKLMPPRWQI